MPSSEQDRQSLLQFAQELDNLSNASTKAGMKMEDMIAALKILQTEVEMHRAVLAVKEKVNDCYIINEMEP